MIPWRKGLVSLLIALAVGPAPYNGDAARAQSPAASWSVDGSTGKCILSRSEGQGQGFVVRTYPGLGTYELILAAPGMAAHFRSGPQRFRIELLPSGPPVSAVSTPISIAGKNGAGAYFASLPENFIERLASANALVLFDANEKVASFSVPSARKAIDALSFCEHGKLEEWGADPRAFERGATQPKPIGNFRSWLTARDLSKKGRLLEGFAALRFRINPEGRIENCTVLESNHNQQLDEVACAKMTARARYEPARDSIGKPIGSAAVYIAAWPCPDCLVVDAINVN